MQIGKIGGLCAARIDGNNHYLVWIAGLPALDPFENYGMTIRRVGTNEEKTIGAVDISVAARRTIRTER